MIELLVVIAIIGILSGLIIVSMSGAQNAAKDARIKAAMDQMRSTAEIYKLNNGYYNNSGAALNLAACTATASSFIATGSDMITLCNDIQNQNSNTLLIAATNGSTTTKYCIQKTLADNSAKWCIDYTGAVGSTNVSCDTTNYTCLSD